MFGIAFLKSSNRTYGIEGESNSPSERKSASVLFPLDFGKQTSYPPYGRRRLQFRLLHGKEPECLQGYTHDRCRKHAQQCLPTPVGYRRSTCTNGTRTIVAWVWGSLERWYPENRLDSIIIKNKGRYPRNFDSKPTGIILNNLELTCSRDVVVKICQG